MSRVQCQTYRVRDVLTEVTKGVGPTWQQYRVVGATRDGIAPAKAAVGKTPERYKPVHPGTVFYNPMRILIGSIAMIREGEPSGITSPDYVVVRAVEDKLDPGYFYYWLRSRYGEHFIKSHARGAVRERLTFARLADAELSLPPIAWQRRFAAAMGEAAVAHAAAQERIEAASALRRSALSQFFSDIESPERSKLGKLIERTSDIVHPRDNPSGTATFVGLEHIEAHTGRQIGSLAVDLSELNGRKPRFRKGEIVYGYLRPYLNKVWVAEFDGLCSVDQFTFRADATLVRTEFVAAFMRTASFLESAASVTSTGQLPRIGIGEIERVEMPLPSLERQDELLQRLQEIMASCDRIWTATTTEARSIETLPARLLADVFSDDRKDAGTC